MLSPSYLWAPSASYMSFHTFVLLFCWWPSELNEGCLSPPVGGPQKMMILLLLAYISSLLKCRALWAYPTHAYWQSHYVSPVQAVTSAISSGLQQQCHAQKMVLWCSSPYLLAFTFLRFPLQDVLGVSEENVLWCWAMNYFLFTAAWTSMSLSSL